MFELLQVSKLTARLIIAQYLFTFVQEFNCLCLFLLCTPDLHNHCQIGFHRTPPQELAALSDTVAVILQQNDERGVDEVGGKYQFDLAKAATTMQVPVTEVQRDLMRLKVSLLHKHFGIDRRCL